MDTRQLIGLLPNINQLSENNSDEINKLTKYLEDFIILLLGKGDWKRTGEELRRLFRLQATVKVFHKKLDDLFHDFQFNYNALSCDETYIKDLVNDLSPRAIQFYVLGSKGFKIQFSKMLLLKELVNFSFNVYLHIAETKLFTDGSESQKLKAGSIDTKTYFSVNNGKIRNLYKEMNLLIADEKNKKPLLDNYFPETIPDMVLVTFKIVEIERNLPFRRFRFTISGMDVNGSEVTLYTSNFDNGSMNEYEYLFTMNYDWIVNGKEPKDIKNYDIVDGEMSQDPDIKATVTTGTLNSRGFGVDLLKLDDSKLEEYDITYKKFKYDSITYDYTKDGSALTGLTPWLFDQNSSVGDEYMITWFQQIDSVYNRFFDLNNWKKPLNQNELFNLRIRNLIDTFNHEFNIQAVTRLCEVIMSMLDFTEQLINKESSGEIGILTSSVEGVVGVTSSLVKLQRSAIIYENVHIDLSSIVSRKSIVRVPMLRPTSKLWTTQWTPGERPGDISENEILYNVNYPSNFRFQEVYGISIGTSKPVSQLKVEHVFFENDDAMVVLISDLTPGSFTAALPKVVARDPRIKIDMSNHAKAPSNYSIPFEAGTQLFDGLKTVTAQHLTAPAFKNSRIWVLSKKSLTAVTPSISSPSVLSFTYATAYWSDPITVICSEWTAGQYTFSNGTQLYGIYSNIEIVTSDLRNINGLDIGVSEVPVKTPINGEINFTYDQGSTGETWTIEPNTATLPMNDGTYGFLGNISITPTGNYLGPNIAGHMNLTIDIDYNVSNPYSTGIMGVSNDVAPMSFSDENIYKWVMTNGLDAEENDHVLVRGREGYMPNALVNGIYIEISKADVTIAISTSYGGGGAIKAFSDEIDSLRYAIGLQGDQIRNLDKRVTNLEARVEALEKSMNTMEIMALVDLGISLIATGPISNLLLKGITKLLDVATRRLVRLSHFLVESSFGNKILKYIFSTRSGSYNVVNAIENLSKCTAENRALFSLIKVMPDYSLVKSLKSFDDLYKQDRNWCYLSADEFLKVQIDGLNGYKKSETLLDNVVSSRISDPLISTSHLPLISTSSIGEASIYARPLDIGVPKNITKFLAKLDLDKVRGATEKEVRRWCAKANKFVHTYLVTASIEIKKDATYFKRTISGVGEANAGGVLGGDLNAQITSYTLNYHIKGRDVAGRLILSPLSLTESGFTEKEINGIYYTLFKQKSPYELEETLSAIYDHTALRILADTNVSTYPFSASRLSSIDLLIRELGKEDWGYKLGIFTTPKNCQTYAFEMMDWIKGGPLPSFVSQRVRGMLVQAQMEFLDANTTWAKTKQLYISKLEEFKSRHKREVLEHDVPMGSVVIKYDSVSDEYTIRNTNGATLLEFQTTSELLKWVNEKYEEFNRSNSRVKREKIFNQIMKQLITNTVVRYKPESEIDNLVVHMRMILSL